MQIYTLVNTFYKKTFFDRNILLATKHANIYLNGIDYYHL